MRWRRVAYGMVTGFLLLAGLAPWWLPHLVTYGPSRSLPKGWYVRAWRQGPLQVGDYVVLTTPASMQPYMPVGVPAARILKQIAAVEGTWVCWTEAAMIIGAPGRPRTYAYHPEAPVVRHPEQCAQVQPGELVLVGTSPRSVDSRYLGPMAVAYCQWRAVPLWTWDGE